MWHLTFKQNKQTCTKRTGIYEFISEDDYRLDLNVNRERNKPKEKRRLSDDKTPSAGIQQPWMDSSIFLLVREVL